MLVESVELFRGHRSHSSVPIFIEAVQGDMFTRYKSGVHEALDNNPKTARWQWLHNDSNRCRTPFYGEMLNRLRRRLFKLLKSEFSKPCATLINDFRNVARDFGNVRIEQLS